MQVKAAVPDTRSLGTTVMFIQSLCPSATQPWTEQSVCWSEAVCDIPVCRMVTIVLLTCGSDETAFIHWHTRSRRCLLLPLFLDPFLLLRILAKLKRGREQHNSGPQRTTQARDEVS